MSDSSLILPPSIAVSLTWQFTSIFSENSSYKLIKGDYENILNGLIDLAKEVDKKDPKKKDLEQRYVKSSIILIKSALRNLQIIIDGRNLNFKEENELRQKSQDLIDNFSTFSRNLQSIIPRLGSVTVAGAAGGIPIATLVTDLLEKWIPKDVVGLIFPLTIAGVAGIGYIVNSVVITPYLIKRFQSEKIRADYHRNLYFEQFIDKSQLVLVDLYCQICQIHDQIFQNSKSDKTKNDAEKFVENLLAGSRGRMCKYVHKHMQDKKVKITDKLWALCETGHGISECEYYKKEDEELEKHTGR